MVLEKIKILGKRNGIQVIEVNPAYTSIIGAYKYCPQYLIKQEISKINKDIKLLIQNLNSDPEAQQQVNQRKEPVREECKYSYKLWRVVKVALGRPILGKSFVRDLSPLRVFLVDWDRVSRRSDPVLPAGSMVSQIPPADRMANLKRRDTNRSAKSVYYTFDNQASSG